MTFLAKSILVTDYGDRLCFFYQFSDVGDRFKNFKSNPHNDAATNICVMLHKGVNNNIIVG